MKSFKLMLLISILSLGMASGAFIFSYKNHTKVGFVLIRNVFNEFDMKKEMEGKYAGVRNARKKILDSLQIDISVLAKRISQKNADDSDKNLFERKKMEFNQKMEMFDMDNASLSKQLDEQIITQLNQYVTDFGKENHFDIIYGNTTDGSIMFGTDELNCTNEVVKYINEKYKGIK